MYKRQVLALTCSEVIACGAAIRAVDVDVHSLTLDLGPLAELPDLSAFRAAVPCMETALTSLPALRTFRLANSGRIGPFQFIRPSRQYVSLLMPVLARLPQQECLDLVANDIDATELAPPLACLPALTALHLHGNIRDKPDAAAIIAPALSRLSRLASLTLAGDQHGSSFLCADAFIALPLGYLTALTALDLSNNSLHGAALAPALDSLRQLAVLNLKDNFVGFGDGGLGPEGAAALAPPLGRLAALTALNLDNNCFKGDSMEALAPALSRLSRLARLVLCKNEMGAAATAALAPPLGLLTALTLLDLSFNFTRTSGAAALAPSLRRLSMLADLDLSHNDICSRGVAALAPALASLTALTRLDISGNTISDRGCRRLAPALTHLTALRRLAFKTYSGISAAGVAAVLDAVPASVWIAPLYNHRR